MDQTTAGILDGSDAVGVLHRNAMNKTSASGGMPAPIFIMSPSPRCGTNYLAHILLLDTSLQIPECVWEDHLLVHSDLLEQYARSTARAWEPENGDYDELASGLLAHIGDGILEFLQQRVGAQKRVLCKTPRAFLLENFFGIFPGAKLLLLIRDGRDVVQSMTRTWPERFLAFERSARTWARGTRLTLDFLNGRYGTQRGKSWELVRYEDLVRHPEDVIRNVQGFLDMDIESFDYSRIQELGLRGSSVHHGSKSNVHWEPVQKPKDFRPIGRWKDWSVLRKIEFKAIAGRELCELGYAPDLTW